jgi:hypothetical protein
MDRTLTPKELREHLLQALEADLIGPFRLHDGHAAQELLGMAPSRWYHTGFLAPESARDTQDPTSDEQLDVAEGAVADEPEPGDPDPKQRKFFPASIGLSVLLPRDAKSVTALVSFADYAMFEEEVQGEGKRKRKLKRWRRMPVVVEPVLVPLDGAKLRGGIAVPNTAGIVLEGRVIETDVPGPRSTERALALSLFVVNRRTPEAETGLQDRQFIFQVKLRVESEQGILARPNVTDLDAGEWDDKVSDLQFRGVFAYAVGHGVSVDVPDCAGQVAAHGRVTAVETTWLPRQEVPRVTTRDCEEITTEMSALGALESADDIERALGQLPVLYSAWIEQQRAVDVGGGERADTQDALMDKAARACQRIREGIALLKASPEALHAFRLANQAMATQSRRRNPKAYEAREPAWRLFQLAFVLLNLPAIADPQHEHRDDVELIFFPTGGGKTEAYLGVIAFTLLLRRMQGQARADRGLGVAVILRYTLRLLTLDQLERAATLMCALELLRKQDPARLGNERFAIGLWVGKSATENRLQDVAQKVSEFKNKTGSSPCPLVRCPWCGKELTGEGMTLEPSAAAPERLVTACPNWECDFCGDQDRTGLPLVYVDEQVYNELPCFVLATVDKFAMVPWRGESGMLFGKVQARTEDRFFGPMQRTPRGATPLPGGLLPPELIVQDELHLISGPLGTMVGLYETAIEQLCTREQPGGKGVRPKIVASTATVRRANRQIAALYGRKPSRMRLFPPQGVDDSETFFATIDRNNPGRLYVGVAAPGRAMKATLLRSYVNLLSAAEHLFDRSGDPNQPADHYMTVAGYFNSLKELGGMRRLVEDDARTRAEGAEARAPLDFAGRHPWWKKRTLAMEPLELTSREATSAIKANKELLKTPYLLQGRRRADVLLASNMISVGVDIDRLGVMVVAGQPKTTAEYIQASSRVGRPATAAGLVVTCFNMAKPRDRSHYEGFCAYHECFYRYVEATSVTPFSLPALERGMAGVLVAMARFSTETLTQPLGVNELEHHRASAAKAVDALVARARELHDETFAAAMKDRAENLLDDWEAAVRETREGGGRRVYSGLEKVDAVSLKPLLRGVLDEELAYDQAEARFIAPTSMRDVEASVHLWIPKDGKGGDA